jgi:hypothetical protein
MPQNGAKLPQLGVNPSYGLSFGTTLLLFLRHGGIIEKNEKHIVITKQK